MKTSPMHKEALSCRTNRVENTKKFDALVLIGRFQPLHLAHIELLKLAASKANKVIIIVGSADKPRTYKNPFSYAERKTILENAVWQEKIDAEFCFNPNIDTVYNDQAWAARVQDIVSKHTNKNQSVGIIGHKKDASSFYLDMFPQWEFVDVDAIPPPAPLNATDIRELYFRSDCNLSYLQNVVPESTVNFLAEFMQTPDFRQLVREREFIEEYKKQYASYPYPPIFVTCDACVICSGHVLMIKRKSEPGKGLWALPGGFVNANTDSSVKAACIRELREETGIKVPAPVLNGSIAGNCVFDAIDRSSRGRTITHAFHIKLPEGPLPKVKGMDDAAKAKWIPISEIKSAECFEDHYEIISYFVGV